MEIVNDIKEYDVVKYLKSIYLVKSFIKLENRTYQLNYYFASIHKSGAKLYNNKTKEISIFYGERINRATDKEIKFLLAKIHNIHPNFDTSNIEKSLKSETLIFNEKNCINYLKSKGYIILKQV